MTRQQKYPDTDTFHYHNQNPKNRITGDCAIRAISTGTGIPYNEVVMGLARLQCETGYDADKCIDKYMKSVGWVKQKQPRKDDGTKYTGADFCRWLSVNYGKGQIGDIVCNIGGHHMVAIKPTNSGDGINCRYKVHDIWNSTYKCIGNYWTKG